MKNKNKKYILLFAGVVIFVIIFAIVVFFTSGGKTNTITPSSESTGQSTPANNMQNGTSSSVTLPPLAANASDAAKQFYTYYFSSSTNPLANGAYKSNPYISQIFKNIIATAYDNGNVPIFCSQDKTANVSISSEQQVPYGNETLTEVIISEVSPQKKDLDDVLLENTTDKWQIVDINCIP